MIQPAGALVIVRENGVIRYAEVFCGYNSNPAYNSRVIACNPNEEKGN